MCYGIMDARHRLRPPYNQPRGYPGYCLSMSPMGVPLSLITSNTQRTDKDILLLIAAKLKERYTAQKVMPSFLAVIAQQVELMVQSLLSGPP
jgi:hypothetical protein